MYRGKEIPFNDFSGGLVTNRPTTELKLNELSDLDNVVIAPKGAGFRARYGDTALNGTAMNSGANVQGLGYYKLVSGSTFLVAVCGNKLYSTGTGITGTMADITGSLTITGAQDNIWDIVIFNNKAIGFGGPSASPNAPWVWTGTGNASALGGTPPSAYAAFQTNNRVFAFRTSTNPSTIYWSVLSNEADWTGTGSGSSDVWTSDNDSLTAHAILNTNTVLLFKENSTHQMQTGDLINGAFPIYPLFKGVGCAGKHACVVVDGLAYFITPQGKMKVTDGLKLYSNDEIPHLGDIDDQLQQVTASRRPFIQGIRKTGTDYDHILWFVSYGSSQTSNNRVFIWDLLNQCWLQHTTGYAANVAAVTQDSTLYAGHFNGVIYKKDASTATYTDASNSAAVVDGYVASGWIHNSKFETIQQPRRFNLSFVTQTLGQIRLSYGFDFNSFSQLENISQVSASGDVYDATTAIYDVSVYAGTALNVYNLHLTGRGNFFQYKIESPKEAIGMKINGFTLSGKEYGQKVISAR
jgi:hypothetical protein